MTRVEMKTTTEMGVHSLDKGGRAAIHLAVVSGFQYRVNYESMYFNKKPKKLVQLVLEQGARLDLKDDVLEWTPLEYAMASKSWDIVELLLDETKPEYNLELYKKHIKSIQSPLLHHAAAYGFIKLVNLHILAKDNVWAQDERGATALHATCSSVRGSLKVAKALVESIGDVHGKVEDYLNKCDKEGNSALHFACKKSHSAIVEFLISSGADVWTRNDKFELPLHMFLSSKSVPILKSYFHCLQNRNISVENYINLQDASGMSLLHWSVLGHWNEVTDLLISNGGDVLLKDICGKNPLLLACEVNSFKCVEAIIDSFGSNEDHVRGYINESDRMGLSAIHYACHNNFDVGIVKKFISKGANVWLVNYLLETPLIIASKFGFIEKVQALIDTFGDNREGLRDYINTADSNGMSAKDWADIKNEKEILRLLINVGDELIENEHSKASENKGKESNTLQEHLMDISILADNIITDHEGINSPQQMERPININLASALHERKIERKLWLKSANIWTWDQINMFPLHYACLKGETEIVQAIIMSFDGNKGNISECINAPSQDMWSALHFASQEGHLDIVNLLLKYGADRGAKTHKQDNPLHISCMYSRIECVKALITSFNGNEREISEYVNLSGQNETSALHTACHEGNSEIVKLLLEHGAEREAKNMQQYNALHIACSASKIDCVKTIITSFNGNEREIREYVNSPGRNKRSALHIVCEYGFSEIVSFLIKNGADREAKTINLANPLHLSCFHNKMECVKALITSFNGNKTDVSEYVNISGQKEMTALHLACQMGHSEIVQLLLENGAEREAKDLQQYNPFHISCIKNKIDCVKTVISSFNGNRRKIREYINLPGQNESSALHFSCQKGHSEMINLLLKHGADREAKNIMQDNPFHISCSLNKIDCVKALIMSFNGNERAIGEYVNLRGQSESSALHVSCQEGHSEIVNLLVEHGADIEAKCTNQNNPLHFSCVENHIECVKALIKSFNGNEREISDYVNLSGQHGCSALHIACEEGYLDIVNFLLDHGADRETKDRYQDNPLHKSCVNDGIECVKALIKSFNENESEIREYVNISGQNGSTALHLACQMRHSEIVKLLLKNGADREAKNIQQNNPLHISCVSGDIECFNALIMSINGNERKINEYINIPGQHEWSALQIACQQGNSKIANLLMKHGADREAKNIQQNNPLHLSCFHNKMECVKELIRSFDGNERAIIEYVNLRGHDERTALHFSCQNGHTDIVKFLLKFGAVREVMDDEQKNPLHIACHHNKIECVTALIMSFDGNEKAIGEYVNIPDANEWYALHFACKMGQSEIVNLLLKHGAEREAKNIDQNNPLHVSCINNKIDCVKSLIKSFNGREKEITEYINLPGHHGDSALHFACEKDDLNIVNLILRYGAGTVH